MSDDQSYAHDFNPAAAIVADPRTEQDVNKLPLEVIAGEATEVALNPGNISMEINSIRMQVDQLADEAKRQGIPAPNIDTSALNIDPTTPNLNLGQVVQNLKHLQQTVQKQRDELAVEGVIQELTPAEHVLEEQNEIAQDKAESRGRGRSPLNLKQLAQLEGALGKTLGISSGKHLENVALFIETKHGLSRDAQDPALLLASKASGRSITET